MKQITHNLLKFVLSLVLLTFAFRFALSTFLAAEQISLILLTDIIYGISVFLLGWIFGKKDKVSFPVYDIGFRFHFATYLVFMLVSEIWLLTGFQSSYEDSNSVHLTGLFWGIGVLLHFVFYMMARKNSYKGLKKSDIFE